MAIIIKRKKYQESKESIRMMNTQRSDTKKINLIEQGKKLGIDKVKKNPKVLKTNNGKTMILWRCAICGSKKSRFIKKQEASGILSNLGIKILKHHLVRFR